MKLFSTEGRYDCALEKEKGKVLDVGCGNFYSARNIVAKKEKEIYYIGLDYNINYILEAKNESKKLQNADFVAADARYLPFRKDSFDVVLDIGTRTIKTKIESERILNKEKEVLKNDGKYMVLHDCKFSNIEEDIEYILPKTSEIEEIHYDPFKRRILVKAYLK